MITMWYLQSHRTWDSSCHSCIGSPSRPLGPSGGTSLWRWARRCTPDRWKLFGSHGQRPWLHDVVITRGSAGRGGPVRLEPVLLGGERLGAAPERAEHGAADGRQV